MSNLSSATIALNTQRKTNLAQIKSALKKINAPSQISEHQANMELIKSTIKEERLKQNMTQRTLAAISGMSQGTITRAERHCRISLWALIKISQALGKDLNLTNKIT